MFRRLDLKRIAKEFVMVGKKMEEKPLLWGSLGLSFGVSGLYELREYHKTMERVILSTGEWQLSSVEKRLKELPENKKEDVMTLNYPYRWMISYPNELRSSIIIAGMSYFESQLNNISCDAKYFSGKVFQKPSIKILSFYREYLKNYGKLKISNSEGWKKLNSIYRLRNLLIHNGMSLGSKTGDLSSDIEEIRKIVDGIDLDSEGYYVIHSVFCEQMFDELELFFKGLENQIKKTWER